MWLHEREVQILLYLYEKGRVHFSRITRDVTKHPNLTRHFVNKLIKKGLVNKIEEYEQWKPDTKPIKVSYYFLTSKGIRLAEILSYAYKLLNEDQNTTR